MLFSITCCSGIGKSRAACPQAAVKDESTDAVASDRQLYHATDKRSTNFESEAKPLNDSRLRLHQKSEQL